jgi:glycerol-3-phosphate acyltransferase PlsY
LVESEKHMQWLDAVALIFAAYLLGSLPSGYLIGRWVGNIDVRSVGSGNIGATNVARSLGFKWGLLVLIMDMTKGALPVLLALNLWPAAAGGSVLKVTMVALAAFLGHLYSPFLRFRGGKGVATAFGISLVLLPKAALVALLFFLLVTWLWRYVSLGSLTGSVSLPVWTAAAGYHPLYIGLASIFALCIVIRHISNIRDLMKGRERKL